MDNLNTHKAASLYERFAPEEARRILRQLEFHYHGFDSGDRCRFDDDVVLA